MTAIEKNLISLKMLLHRRRGTAPDTKAEGTLCLLRIKNGRAAIRFSCKDAAALTVVVVASF